MDDALNQTRTVELTVSDIVLTRNALRYYAENMFGHVKDAMTKYDILSAKTHERTVAHAIDVLWKLEKEE